MDIHQFGKGFEISPQDQKRMSDREWASGKNSIADPFNKWSLFFSRVASDYLNGNEFAVAQTLADYTAYTSDLNKQYMERAVQNTERSAFDHESLVSELNGMNFHTMNQPMAANWLNIIDPDKYVPPTDIDTLAMQATLAVRALRLVESRREFAHQFIEEKPGLKVTDSVFDTSFVGRITELDAAIALLEMTKRRRGDETHLDERLVVVPAPSIYERYPGKASDFLLFDKLAGTALGIQVKARLGIKREYDQNYVSFIDGIDDLGNVRHLDVSQDDLLKMTVPGLLSADFLLNNEDLNNKDIVEKYAAFAGIRGPMVHAHHIAKTMEQDIDYTDRLEKSVLKITPRLIGALHKNEPK